MENKTKKPFEGHKSTPAQGYSSKGKHPRGQYDRRNAQNRRPAPRNLGRFQQTDTGGKIEAWIKKNPSLAREIRALFKFAVQTGIQVTKTDMEEVLDQSGVTSPVSIPELMDYFGSRR